MCGVQQTTGRGQIRRRLVATCNTCISTMRHMRAMQAAESCCTLVLQIYSYSRPLPNSLKSYCIRSLSADNAALHI